MRTTLNIDDDLLIADKELSRLQRRSAGQVVSDLIRQALSAPASVASGFPTAPGFRPFASRGTPVTNGTIDQLRDLERA